MPKEFTNLTSLCCLLFMAGCAATPRAEIKPAKSSVKTDLAATPETHTRTERIVLRINAPEPVPSQKKETGR